MRHRRLALPLVAMDPFEVSATAKIRLAVRAIRDGTAGPGALAAKAADRAP